MEESAPNEHLIPKVSSIKKEAFNDDIKEFAETAMNELLGWYGYGNSKEAKGCKSKTGSNSSGPESPKFNEGCGWCGKPVDENTALSSAAAVFCSELCFSQSRRASFKKNKTCDWCRHVRHTISYVDSQDGNSQLQFCSDKCLNQYKMHIFWRETRAHLEVHPHIHNEESSGSLITPDLWMNKCKSPDRPTCSPSSSPKTNDHQQTFPLPLITVAHPSKLLSMPPETFDLKRQQRNKIHRKNKRKLNGVPICTNSTITNSNNNVLSDMPQDLRVRHTPISFDGDDSPRDDPHNSATTTNQKRVFDGLLPPPTILVPYPFLLPIPIPIPIPIPLPISSNLLNRKTNIEEGTQTIDEEITIKKVLNDKSDINKDIDNKTTRPLRKRKKVLDKNTSKVPVKNKRVLLT